MLLNDGLTIVLVLALVAFTIAGFLVEKFWPASEDSHD